MLKKALSTSAAAAALSCVFAIATAQEVVTPVELEGPVKGFTGSTKTLNVMDIDVIVSGATSAISPSADRRSADSDGTALGWGNWFKGDRLPGRKQRGFVQGTAIVTGNWVPSLNAVVADEVFTEPAENVVLGVIDNNVCLESECDGPGDFIRGNGGPAMISIEDTRIPAGPITDEGGFLLDVSNQMLDGLPYAMEGYYGNKKEPAPDTGVEEFMLYYFALSLGGFHGELLANKGSEELSVLGAQCRVGDRMDIRGAVHSEVDDAGEPVDAVGAAKGIIEVRFPLSATQDFVRTTAEITPTAEDGVSAFAEYRIRFDTPVCPDSVSVNWLDSTGPGSTTFASATTELDILDDTAE